MDYHELQVLNDLLPRYEFRLVNVVKIVIGIEPWNLCKYAIVSKRAKTWLAVGVKRGKKFSMQSIMRSAGK